VLLFALDGEPTTPRSPTEFMRPVSPETLVSKVLKSETSLHSVYLFIFWDLGLILCSEVKYKLYGYSTHTRTHTRLTALMSGSTRVSQYQKGKTNLDYTEARDSV